MTGGDQLVEAAGDGDLDRIRRLLDAGIDPNGPDAEGTTALYAACSSGIETLELLVSRGADPNRESLRADRSAGLPLCLECCWGITPTVEALLRLGADPNLREDEGEGQTPLSWAAWGGYDDVVEILLAHGADPNLALHNMPLLQAAGRGFLSTARLLLAAGADPLTRNHRGETALELAELGLGDDQGDASRLAAQLVSQLEFVAGSRATITTETRNLGDGEFRVIATARKRRRTIGTRAGSVGGEALVELLRTASRA